MIGTGDRANAANEDAADVGSHERALWTSFRTTASKVARERLFFSYQAFARSVAKRHFLDRRGGDIEFNDLCQLGYAGLLQAIDGYDPDRGASFKTYAVRRITGSIRDGVVKTSEVREQISHRARARRERVQSLTNLDVDAAPLGDALQALSEIAVGLALGFMLEGTNLYLAEERDRSADAYEGLAWKEATTRMLAELAKLPERDQLIIKSHYLDGLNFETIGDLLDITKGRVSQLHRASLTLLRKRLTHINDVRNRP